MSPTIKDVARELGLDASTVSLALRNRPRIAAATRLRVLEAAQRLGYVPNRAAQALRSGRSHTLSLVLWGSAELELPYTFSEPALSVANAAFHAGYAVLLLQATAERLHEQSIARFPELRQTDGALLVGETQDRKGLMQLVREGYPLIHLGERYVDDGVLPFVSGDFAQGSALAAEHFLTLGHRRMAVLRATHENIPEIPARRVAGFCQAAGEHLVDVVTVDEQTPLAPIIQTLHHQGVTAVFSTAPSVAFRFSFACRDVGMSIPHDISLIAFEDSPEMALASPPITCIRQPRDLIGERAVQLLVSAIEEGHVVEVQELLPCTLIERNSVRRLNIG